MKISSTFLGENTKFYVEMVAVKSDVALVTIILYSKNWMCVIIPQVSIQNFCYRFGIGKNVLQFLS